MIIKFSLVQMSYSIVYPRCFNKEGGCFHFASEFIDSIPVLVIGKGLPGFECNKSTSELTSVSTSSCGNPFNRMSGEYVDEIRSARPTDYLTSQPTYGRRPVVNTCVLERDRAVEKIIDFIGADCWSVYTRDTSTHKIGQRLYFGRQTFDETTQAHNQELRAQQRNAIDELLQNDHILKVLETLGDSEELCISMGNTPFIDVYVRKIDCGDTSKWLWTQVHVDLNLE